MAMEAGGFRKDNSDIAASTPRGMTLPRKCIAGNVVSDVTVHIHCSLFAAMQIRAKNRYFLYENRAAGRGNGSRGLVHFPARGANFQIYRRKSLWRKGLRKIQGGYFGRKNVAFRYTFTLAGVWEYERRFAY